MTSTWSIGPARFPKKASTASDRSHRTPRCSTRRSRGRVLQPVGIRPVRMTSTPSARARLAVSRPMPALPPITTTVWPSSSGSRLVGAVGVAVVIASPSVSLPSAAPRRPACDAAAISRAERLQRVDVDLREGREGLDGVAQHVERDARADGERGLLEPLACLGAEGVGAGQPLAVAEEGEEAVRLGVGARVGLGLGELGQGGGAAEAGLGRADRRRPGGRCR